MLQPSSVDIGTSQAPRERLAIYGGPKTIPLIYVDTWRAIRLPEIAKIVTSALRQRATHFGGGGEIGKFERAFCQLTQTAYGITVNSGTAALHSALVATGVGPGDEVIVPSYTFFASVAPILQCGAVPVFCDIDPRTLTACPDDARRRITKHTKAILVVHVWGNPARLDRFAEITRDHDLALIEDCSHAHGASFAGRPVGSWGDVGCFSLQGSKPVSGGEAGVAVTNDPLLHDRMLALGHFGRSTSNQVTGTMELNNLALGVKYRPHLYAMILANAGLRRLPELNRLRRRNYRILQEELADCEAVHTIDCYDEAERGGLLEFILRIHPEYLGGWNRGAFVAAARAEGVRINVDRYSPMHLEPLFSKQLPSGMGGPLKYHPWVDTRPTHGELPRTDQVCHQLLSMMPLTKVSEKKVRQIAKALRKVAAAAPHIHDLRTGV